MNEVSQLPWRKEAVFAGYAINGYQIISADGEVVARTTAHDEATDEANADLLLDAVNKPAESTEVLDALIAAMAFIESHAADPDITEEMCVKYAALMATNPKAIIAKGAKP